MEKFTGYSEQIEINGNTYTVSIIAKGTGMKTVYFSYIMGENGIAKEMSGFPIDQRQAKEPHVYTADEIMELALFEAEDFVNDIDRLDAFENMLFDFMDEVDENRRIQNEIAKHAMENK